MSSDRLTGLDASFLHLEDSASHMHVASVMLFEGPPPPYDELLEAIEPRLGLVPRYRQRLLRPEARPRQAALGDLARRGARGRPLRGAREDTPRARRRRVRRRPHVGAVRHRARARDAAANR